MGVLSIVGRGEDWRQVFDVKSPKNDRLYFRFWSAFLLATKGSKGVLASCENGAYLVKFKCVKSTVFLGLFALFSRLCQRGILAAILIAKLSELISIICQNLFHFYWYNHAP